MIVFCDQVIKIILVLSTVYFAVVHFLMSGDGDQYLHEGNEYCHQRDVPKIDNIICQDKPSSFSNFIWILMDGLAFDQAYPELRRYSQNSNLFRIQNPAYLQSAAIHETYVTGKQSKNYSATKTKVETIFDQMKNNTDIYTLLDTTYFPLYPMVHEDRFSQVRLQNFHPIYALQNLCPRVMFQTSRYQLDDDFPIEDLEAVTDYFVEFFENKHKKKKISSLEACIRQKLPAQMTIEPLRAYERLGLVFYSFKFDTVNHAYSKSHYFTVRHSIGFWYDLRLILKYADDPSSGRPLVIVSSDHGGQKIDGEDEIYNHGRNDNGNEAFLFIYHSSLSNTFSPDAKWIPSTSVAPTISQYFKIGNPLMSEGIAAPIFNTDRSKYVAFRTSEVQFREKLRRFLSENEDLPASLLELEKIDVNQEFASLPSETVEELLQKYPSHLESLKKTIVSHQASLSTERYTDYILFLIISALLYTLDATKIQHLTTKPLNTTLILTLLSLLSWLLGCFSGLIPLTSSHHVGIVTLLLASLWHQSMSTQPQLDQTVKPSFRQLWREFGGFRAVLEWIRPGMRMEIVVICWMMVGNVVFRTNLFTRDVDILDKGVLYYCNFGFYFVGLMFCVMVKDYVRRKGDEKHQESWLSQRLANSASLVAFALVAISICVYYDLGTDTGEHSEYMMVSRSFYVLLLVYLIVSQFALRNSFMISFKSKYDDKMVYRQGWDNGIFLFVTLLFWLDNNRNRFYLTLFVWPMLEFMRIVILDLETRDPVKRPRIMYLMILMAFNAYTLMNNNFGLEISLKAGNRTWGEYQDQTPIFTGLIFAIHKMGYFFLSSILIQRASNLSIGECRMDIRSVLSNADGFVELSSKLGVFDILVVILLLGYFNQSYASRSEETPLPYFMWYLCTLSCGLNTGLALVSSGLTILSEKVTCRFKKRVIQHEQKETVCEESVQIQQI